MRRIDGRSGRRMSWDNTIRNAIEETCGTHWTNGAPNKNDYCMQRKGGVRCNDTRIPDVLPGRRRGVKRQEVRGEDAWRDT